MSEASLGGIGLGISVLSLLIWLGLLLGRGQFWRSNQRLEPEQDEAATSTLNPDLTAFPSVCAVIPARNEAELLPVTLRSLLTQDYPGPLTVILVDDHSTDGTTAVAQATASTVGRPQQLVAIAAEPLPPGWTGKLWAMEQGIQKAQGFSPDYILLTDADIEHNPANLRRLVEKAVQQDLEMASVMVRLRCESVWEQLLIPAFVFFFQKLYPFRWVNDPNRAIAAAAGGCILIRRSALEQIGGIQAVRHALIDDCALAQAVKLRGWGTGNRRHAHHKIWLGLSSLTRSLRPYPSLATIWDMVARTAYTQLNYSPWQLLGTLVGMTLIYLVPPIAALVGAITGQGLLALIGLLGWLMMTLAYWPTVQFYRCSPVLAGCLPAIASLYTLMTLDSALRHWQGRGGAWKGRTYDAPKGVSEC